MKEAITKTETMHWMENKIKLQESGRPEYMTKLRRKQCNALIKVRSSMIPCKTNQKIQYKDNVKCRFCEVHQETQKHILTECKNNPHKINRPYKELFSDKNCEKLKEAAETSPKRLKQWEKSRTSRKVSRKCIGSPQDEPPGHPGSCNATTTASLWHLSLWHLKPNCTFDTGQRWITYIGAALWN